MTAQFGYNDYAHQQWQTITAPFGGTFPYYTDGDFWTKLAADTTPTVAVSTTEIAALKLYTDTTNENEVGIKGTNKLFKFQAGKAFYMVVDLQFTELTGNGANVAFGFSDKSSLADTLGDAGAGPSSSITSGVMLYKVDGGTNWVLWAKNNSVVKTFTIDTSVTPGGASYHRFLIGSNVIDGSITKDAIYAQMDGLPLYDSYGRKAWFELDYASAALMYPFVYAKTGTSLEALTVNCRIACPMQTR